MKLQVRIVLVVAAALLLAFVLIGASPAQKTEAAAPAYHVVHYGETLYSIANHYGVNVWSLACANGLYNANFIYAGQVLYIPYGSAWYGSYGCQGYNHPGQYQSPCGCTNQPTCGPFTPYGGNSVAYEGCQGYSQPVQYQSPCGCAISYQHGYDCWYRVRWGDNLSTIAWRYRTTYSNLAYANHISNPNLIYAGMLLRIPGCN